MSETGNYTANTRKLDILEDVLGNYHKTGKEILFYCPECKHHKPKLSINLEKNCFKCWVCNISGRNLSRLVFKHGSAIHKQKWMVIEPFAFVKQEMFEEENYVEPTIQLPEEFVSATSHKLPKIFKRYMNYLEGRGIGQGDILKWKPGFCERGELKHCVVFPSINDKGKCNFYVARSIYEDSWQKYHVPEIEKNEIIFNEINIDFTKDVVLTEGVFDAIVAGENSIPLLGSTLSTDSKLFHRITLLGTPTYIALDPDAERKQREIIFSLLSYGVECYRIEIKPHKDPGSMTKEQFAERKEQAKPITIENFFEYSLQQELNNYK